jgi:hypothetical protein
MSISPFNEVLRFGWLGAAWLYPHHAPGCVLIKWQWTPIGKEPATLLNAGNSFISVGIDVGADIENARCAGRRLSWILHPVPLGGYPGFSFPAQNATTKPALLNFAWSLLPVRGAKPGPAENRFSV